MIRPPARRRPPQPMYLPALALSAAVLLVLLLLSRLQSEPDQSADFSRPVRVGIQIGHEAIAEVPAELSWLRGATGASWGGLAEADVNRTIAELLRDRLVADGIVVDLLPATVPPGYHAHAFIAIHADGAEGELRGWKLSPPRRATGASQRLAEALRNAYAARIDMPEHAAGITRNMLDYYAFPGYGLQHTISTATPAVIMETGFLSSTADRAIIVEQPHLVADALAAGIRDFLARTDFTDRALFRP